METSSQILQTGKLKECPLTSIDSAIVMCSGTECFAFLRDLGVCAYIQGAEVGLELIKKAFRSSAEILPENDFKSFYRKHYSRIYKVAFNLLKNIEKTEDITQEVFIKAYLGFDVLNADTPLAAWLQKVAINSCLDELRRQKVCVVETRADFDNEEVNKKLLECCPCGPEEHYDNQEMKLLIDTVFRTL
ncbi:MAG: sigma-70 family RNA polymerase sigma factor, partial [Actinomycetota bacterium]|nr:sigma-70 family RNA polymerase sigma factor [Actinomycetota bacterium]